MDELILGSDFGAPASAGQQARKIILIEAKRMAPRSYGVEPLGRNERLVRTWERRASWQNRRRGWTVHELAESIATDRSVTVAAFDFPFSIPHELLLDAEFAELVGSKRFGDRGEWATFVSKNLRLSFESERAGATLGDFKRFDVWRDKRFWKRRSTDVATNGSAPLKHKFQNVFAMTLAGVALLERLKEGDFSIALCSANLPGSGRVAFETYPAAIARHCGFAGNYKKSPAACMAAACEFLAAQGISLTIDPSVRQFCLDYSTAGKNADDRDPDGADALLCLVAAICFRENVVELCSGGAPPSVLADEGCIMAPRRAV